MASEKTPNLGLNQIDRTSPKTTYFDLEKYLDQNWRAVDDFAGDVNDGVNEIKKRLDTTERKAVTLEPGVQIVHAEKASPFSLTGMSGRTLVNLLGRWGNLSSLRVVTPYQADIALDTLNKGTMPNSLKVTIKPGYTVGVGFYSNFKFLAGKYYVAIVRAKVGNAIDAGISAPNALVESKVVVTDKTNFATAWFRLAPTSDIITNIDLVTQGTVGQYSYFEAARIYEISAAEYAALATMTDDQIDNKYPYVDSVMPVRNPYAVRYGENLAPHSFYSWDATVGTPLIKDNRNVVVSSSNIMISSIYPLVPGQAYTVSAQSSGATGRIHVNMQNETAVIGNVTGSGIISYTFTVPAGTKGVVIRLLGTSTAEVTISDFMFNIGSIAKPFKQHEDSMLALQTDLYADPVTGANADTVFERDGQYYKSKRWHSMTLDGSLPWGYFDSAAGYKVVRIPATNGMVDSERITKFDGKLVQHVFPLSGPDQSHLSPESGVVGLSISSADSGWGDNYTPTTDEIKAYFMGWKMYLAGQGDVSKPFNNEAVGKAWCPLDSIYDSNGAAATLYVTTLPTTAITSLSYVRYGNWSAYQLVYKLATPTAEPIISEGQLTFVAGDNQVEVGTGIVLREPADVFMETGTMFGNRMNINNASFSARLLRNRSIQPLTVYKDGVLDTRWTKGVGWITSAGTLSQLLNASDSDRVSAYSVTYFMVGLSPVVPFTGIYAANEKTLLLDLIDCVQQANLRLSVVENKKADKDSPSWITPTLLNGVTAETSSVDMWPQYLKMSDNLIKMHGSIKVPTSNATVTCFRLPEGYRPKILTVLTCAASDAVSADKTAVIAISSDGRVEVVGRGGYGWIRLDAVQFIAEV
ncbi:hypothetical protein [Paenibacillus polymyxa]|uniref:hypothetical protein n=1 Tax=Paenibacillus TaxID=44249 RepID=UPI00084627F1|nr:hypothetical protein [Paenibacillus polymyxa]AOK91629.1 hypothetical protein AOU00_18520 [Paenibacillus polymyxa]URJ40672.1 hypothetical protein MF627_000163 [Paenibacillus polymyxa]